MPSRAKKYAVNLLRSGSSPNASWRANTTNNYSGGNGFFRSLTTSAWSATTNDYGFQTWVDPTPTTPYKLRVDPTVDFTYRPGTTPTLIEGETVLYIGGFPGDGTFPEQRPILEFPIGSLPTGAIISGAHLELDWDASSGDPRIEILGYAGDGIAGFNDTTVAGSLLATTPPTAAGDSHIVPIDTTYLKSLVGQASHIGIRLRSLDLGEYIGFGAQEETFPTILPPRLFIDYTLPTTLPGDFNADGKVNGADYVAWRNNDGTPTGYTQWRTNFGATAATGSFTNAAVPEPTSATLLMLCAAAISNRRRR